MDTLADVDENSRTGYNETAATRHMQGLQFTELQQIIIHSSIHI